MNKTVEEKELFIELTISIVLKLKQIDFIKSDKLYQHLRYSMCNKKYTIQIYSMPTFLQFYNTY